jgi:hypothetical protein
MVACDCYQTTSTESGRNWLLAFDLLTALLLTNHWEMYPRSRCTTVLLPETPNPLTAKLHGPSTMNYQQSTLKTQPLLPLLSVHLPPLLLGLQPHTPNAHEPRRPPV